MNSGLNSKTAFHTSVHAERIRCVNTTWFTRTR